MSKIHKKPYRGYSDYNTWNVAQFINCNEHLYRLSIECQSYMEFLSYNVPFSTCDGIKLTDVNYDELNEVIRDNI
jgi:hypothetical protein